ncbi:MAG TPA: DUF2064 domain-containing protein [Rhodanobacteraceae bacterium]|nr:DUF2064 domain-containing protein [Rhodanobacteraceae bacterium]
MNGALAIFVKTPGRSTVKSRLAAECGQAFATEWYRLAAAAVASVARVAQARHGVVAYWAVAEPDALGDWPGLPTLPQGEGGLGERMARVQAALVARHGTGVLLGADAPQLDADVLGEAFDWLAGDAPRFALGPAADGGFWLFGGNRAPPLARWTAARYSHAGTARELHAAMRDLGEWRRLRQLTDVDHARDLPALRDALQALTQPTDEQRMLGQWMRQHDTVPS